MNNQQKEQLKQLSAEIIPLQQELEYHTFLKKNFDDPHNYTMDKIIEINGKLETLRDLYFKLLK